jgi:CubicO group peptidase (beta-lactamase class C family)
VVYAGSPEELLFIRRRFGSRETMANTWPRALGILLLVFAAGSSPVYSQAGKTTQLPDTPAGRQSGRLLAAFNFGGEGIVREYLEADFPGRLNKLDEEAEFEVARGPEVADSPAERQFRGWLSAFNQGDRTALLKFFHDNFPSEVGRIDRDMSFRWRTGGFDFRKAVSATATQFTAMMQERVSDQFAQAVVTVEPDEPHRILSLALRPIPRPPEFAIPRLTEAEVVTELGRKLNEDARKGLFSGAVLVAHHGTPIFSGAYGPANRETAEPNTLTTRFRMGSMNKMFTATAIMQLVQAGKIELGDPLGKFLTDYPNKDVASKVTIRHLLTHTGGTGDIFGPEFERRRLELRTLDDYIALYGSRGVAFEPGTRWAYSNYGFILLGAIVERVAGQSYYDYVRDHIFTPAGMTRTGSEPEDVAVPDRAVGYIGDGDSWTPNTETLPYRGTSAGGGYTTVEDLLRFATALTGHKLLDAHHTDLLTTATPESGDAHYAYGFEDGVFKGLRRFGHSGGAPGMNGDLRIYPQTGFVVIALANMDRGAQRASDWISERLPAK